MASPKEILAKAIQALPQKRKLEFQKRTGYSPKPEVKNVGRTHH